MKQFLRKLWKNEEGAEVVEWIVVAAVLVGIAAGAFFLLGDTVDFAIEGVNDVIESAINKAKTS